MATRVQVNNEVAKRFDSEYELCFQWCLYVYEGGGAEHGYRFMWRSPQGRLLPSRGQARIPSTEILLELVQKAKEEGWGNYDAAVLDGQEPG